MNAQQYTKKGGPIHAPSITFFSQNKGDLKFKS